MIPFAVSIFYRCPLDVHSRGLAARSLGQASFDAVVQLPQKEPRTADHRRPPATLQARRYSARPLAGRIYDGTLERNRRSRSTGGNGTATQLLEAICDGPTLAYRR